MKFWENIKNFKKILRKFVKLLTKIYLISEKTIGMLKISLEGFEECLKSLIRICLIWNSSRKHKKFLRNFYEIK